MRTSLSMIVLDSRTLRLNLGKPVLSVAEDCGEFCTLVVHPSFKAPLSRNPIGTGPYTLAELRVADRCILKRVAKTTDGKDFHYWGGEVFLDEIHFIRRTQSGMTKLRNDPSGDRCIVHRAESAYHRWTIPSALVRDRRFEKCRGGHLFTNAHVGSKCRL